MTGARTSDYDFYLPGDQVAQQPLDERDASRLMVVNRAAGTITHRAFRDIVELIEPRDVLVVNRTRVLRARLLGTRASGAPAEILLLKSIGGGEYEAMVSPGGKLKPGRRVDIAPGFSAEILAVTDRQTRIVRLDADIPLDDAIERFGHVPRPPYIQRPDAPSDAERYQTVFAQERGPLLRRPPASTSHPSFSTRSPRAGRAR
jgi:S-adenosylmethionine:tRNA ribosyltransferase-isomerase